MLPTQTRSGRTIKRKSPVDLGSISFKKSKGEVEDCAEEDDVFGYVKIHGETTSLRFELQQLKIFHETYGKSPTSKENRRLNDLCSRLRQVRKDPKATFIIGNRKPGEKLSDEIILMLGSFNFVWEPRKAFQSNHKTLQDRIQELKSYRKKWGPSLYCESQRRVNKPLLQFSNDLRQSRRNPNKPKYQLSESDISELNSIGFEEAPQKPVNPKVRIFSTTIEKLAGPPANGERYTQMEVIELSLSLIHGKRFVIKAIDKSRFSQDSKQLYQYFPRANQLFTDDIVRELLCKHVIGSDEWHQKVDKIVESKHGPSKAHIYKLFDYSWSV